MAEVCDGMGGKAMAVVVCREERESWAAGYKRRQLAMDSSGRGEQRSAGREVWGCHAGGCWAAELQV